MNFVREGGRLWDDTAGSASESCERYRGPAKLEKLIFELEDAIVLRYREIALEPNRSDEEQALKQAAEQLIKHKIEKLGWSDPARSRSTHGPLANQR